MITPQDIDELKKTFATREELQQNTDVIVKELRNIFILMDERFDKIEERLDNLETTQLKTNRRLDAAIIEFNSHRIVLGEHETRISTLEQA